MNKPLLFIQTPIHFRQDIEPEDIEQEYTEQEYTEPELASSEELPIESESKASPLIQKQLHFFRNRPIRQRLLKFKLLNGNEWIGTLLEFDGYRVKIEVNDQLHTFNANEIFRIQRMPI